MNRQEWVDAGKPTNKYRKIVKQIFKEWKLQCHPNEQCDIHHRDDTEEACEYNEKYYERWGCEDDGTFVEGKYVIFMTRSEHMRHHNTGDSNPTKRPEVQQKMSENNARYWKGKTLSEEHKQKISENHADVSGDKNPAKRQEVRQKISTIVKEQMQATKFLYSTYKENNGKKSWNKFRRALANGDIAFEMQPVSVFINGGTR